MEIIKNQITFIPVDMLEHHPDNPRKNIGDVSELTASIKAKGILQNLTVVPSPEDLEKYYVVIGNRRLEGAKAAGLKEVPAVISDMDYKTQIETMMVENIQREDLTVIEQAEGMQMMLDLGSSVEEVSDKTGFSVSTVRRRLKLNEYDKNKVTAAQERGATLDDFVKLEQVKNKSDRNKLIKVMGIADFGLEFKRVVEEQKNKELEKLALKELRTFAEPFQENEYTWSGKWQQQYNLCYLLKDFKPGKCVPKDKSKKYFYEIYHYGDWRVNIYTKNENYMVNTGRPKKTEEQKQSDRIVRQLNKIAKDHYELRKEFILNLAHKKNIKDYQEICLDTIMSLMLKQGYINNNYNFNKIIYEFLKIDSLYENEEKIKVSYYSNPAGMTVLLTYRLLEDADTMNCYKRPTAESKVLFYKNERLNRIYKFLSDLGYEMSTEETEITTGTSELYQK